MIKELAKRFFPAKYHNTIINLTIGHAIKSYSQEGEDLVLMRIFEGQKKGFYVDIGAHHPKRFSNTYFFYKKGWRGINIDAMPGSMKPFNRTRQRDINLEVPISEKQEMLTYYAFEDPALNGFSEEISNYRINEGIRLLFKKEIETCRLDEVLDKNLPHGQYISFMSVDVEGLDLQVLKSNNWGKYRPNAVVVEMVGDSLESVLKSDLNEYLNGIGYIAYAKTANSCIFLNNQ